MVHVEVDVLSEVGHLLVELWRQRGRGRVRLLLASAMRWRASASSRTAVVAATPDRAATSVASVAALRRRGPVDEVAVVERAATV